MINLPGSIVLPPGVAKNVQIRKKGKQVPLAARPNIMGIW